MSAREPAHPLEKRDLLHADQPNKARIDAIGASLIERNRAPEAIDYVEITHDPALVEKAEQDAVRRGAAWLLQQVERMRGAKATPERWMQLADAARTNERWYDTIRALQFAGRDADAEALRVEKCPDYEPFKPLGK